VGSVGTRCAIVLCLGGAEGDDPLFMQIKEAGPHKTRSFFFPVVGGEKRTNAFCIFPFQEKVSG
jgi:hypothetical protein